MYRIIERDERPAKRRRIAVIAQLLQIEETTLVILWLADKIIVAIGEEKELAGKALNVAQKYIRR
jgi:hypothetical protein